MSTDIKVGDLLECVRSDDSELITKGKTYPVVLSEGGILSLRTDIDGMLLVYLENYLEPKASGSLKFKKVEKMEEFKAGDLVYRVSERRQIKLNTLFRANPYIKLCSEDDIKYLDDGRQGEWDGIPSIFHATPENRQALVTLYGEDAVPELPLRGSELTKKLLESQKFVVAWVSDIDDDQARAFSGYVDVVRKFESGQFKAVSGEEHGFAVPVDPKTGNEITELGGDDE